MLIPRLCVAVALASAALSAQSKTLLFVSRYDSQSLDATAGLLGNARPFDIFAVTPGVGATAFPWLPGAGIAATIGDPDNDGVVAQFAGLPQDSFGLGPLFVKDADRKSGDPRKVYWSVRVPIQMPPRIDVFSGTTVHTIRPGDFVRLTQNGEVEFFIKQEHFVAAAGTQTGNWVNGAGALCQAPNGDLYYAPPNAVSQGGAVAGGHYVNKPAPTWCNDGAICRIPRADITYDTNGNVTSIANGSAWLVAEEVGSGPSAEPSVRTMCVNSGALDSINKVTAVTFTMVGLEIDPNGGIWKGWHDKTVDIPNLIFTFNNTATTCCGGPWGSWCGTVFSTAPNGSSQGSIAKINGMTMGATSGNADGAWTGLKGGTGNASAPVIRGLAWIEAGFKSTAPYGNATLVTPGDGKVELLKDPNVRLMVQGPIGVFPSVLVVGFGVGTGKRPTSFDLSGVFGGYANVHVPTVLFQFGLGASDLKGRSSFVVPLPNDPRLIGLNVTWQGASITGNKDLLTNPVVTEIR